MSPAYKPATNHRPSCRAASTFLDRLRRVNRLVVVIETTAAATLVIAVVVVVFLQVVMRYALARPNPWSEELSRFCFIWLSMLGASLAIEKNAQFVFDELIRQMAPAWRQRVRYAVTALVVAILLMAMVLGIELVNLVRTERSAALNLPIVWVYTALPVGAGLMLLHLVTGLHRPPEDIR